nr:hypothetical protein [Tanacetum cinerariifolium]
MPRDATVGILQLVNQLTVRVRNGYGSGIDFCLVDCLEGCGIGGGLRDGDDAGNVEDVEIELVEAIGGGVVVFAANDDVGVDVGSSEEGERLLISSVSLSVAVTFVVVCLGSMVGLSESIGSVLVGSESAYGVQGSKDVDRSFGHRRHPNPWC